MGKIVLANRPNRKPKGLIAGLVVEAASRIDKRSWLGLNLTIRDKAALRAWSNSKGVAETLYHGIDLVSGDVVWEIETALSLLDTLP